MTRLLAIALASAVGLVPLAVSAQTNAPMKSERAMPDSNAKAGTPKAGKSERAMTGPAKTHKAKAKGSERAMDNGQMDKSR